MKITQLIKQSFAVLVVATLVCGCASGRPDSIVKTTEPMSYRLDPEVLIKRPIQYGSNSSIEEGMIVGATFGSLAGAAAGAAVGIAGGAISRSIHSEELAALKGTTEENHIDISAIVRAKFVEQLSNFPKLQASESPDSVLMQVTLRRHGFDRQAAGDTRYAPYVILKAQMVDKSGKVIWDNASPDNFWVSTPLEVGASLKQYADDPNKLRSDWEKQITIAVRRLMGLPVKKPRR